MSRRAIWLLLASLACRADEVARWEKARARPLTSVPGRHSIHTYVNASPESPDGKRVLFYTSVEREAYRGEVRFLDRESGRETVLARGVEVEDAHRAACQQWISGGKRAVFHDYRRGEWMVVAVDAGSLRETILARGRMLGWGRPAGDLVPVYGPHWAPGAHPDLELLNAATGEIRVAVTAADVRKTYPEMVAREFGERPISIFFPILSPDGSRVFFKLATPTGKDFRSKDASHREMLVAYDLAARRFLFARAKWGHPAWMPDSRTIMNMYNVLIDSDLGAERLIPGLPKFRGSHPCPNPKGGVWATDSLLDAFGGSAADWGVAVAGVTGGGYTFLHRFDNTKGAASWRVSHPHPSFSPDGERVYFNVNETEWTQLFVADAAR